jgi:hypothetical protein
VAPVRRFALLAVAAFVLAGCAEPPPAGDAGVPVDEDPARTAREGRRGEGEGDNRTAAVIGSASGGPVGPGIYPLHLQVPHGGANAVTWFIEVVPLATFMLDGVQGPGCESFGWHTSFTSSGTTGRCSEVAEGPHEWEFTLNAPVVSYRVEVHGRVWDPRAPTNATADATER